MKFNKDKIKEFMKSRYGKPLIFFGFYFIFFAFVLLLLRPSGTVANDIDENTTNVLNNIVNNYEYRYDVTLADGQVITLEGKKYNNKSLFTKMINDITDSEIYNFYDDTYVKNGDKWVPNGTYVLIDQGFNNQYFDIDYLKTLIADAELIDSKTNFDDTKSDFYEFGNIAIEVVRDKKAIKKIDIIDPLYKINMQYKNINEVKDFVVEK